MEEKEKRIRAITGIYYSNPKIQNALFEFSQGREVVPRYLEAFGKRPDSLIYISDVINLVKKGATSFHASEELWNDPLRINSDMGVEEMNYERKGWDLLIDIDSPFLDCSKIAAELVIELLEHYNVKNYGLKFSGKKGFHILVGNKAFPENFEGKKMKDMFPDWPRAICQHIIAKIRPVYNRKVAEMNLDMSVLEERTKKKREDLTETLCPECGRPAKKGKLIKLMCDNCKTTIERKDPKITKRKLKCVNDSCAGILQVIESKDYNFCEYCDSSSWDKESGGEVSGFKEEISASSIAALDLVLVAPRHLFRMPYSLHESTALSSIVLRKEDIKNFDPKMANPLMVNVHDFLPKNFSGEAQELLARSLEWKAQNSKEEEKFEKKKYGEMNFKEIDFKSVDENLFPKPIKKLLKGLEDGKKRGLFVLITFYRALNYPKEIVYSRIDEWNKKNKPPLREAYVRGQIEWHYKQRKKILPPNYSNEGFYKDLGLLDEMPRAKNPLSEISARLRN